MKKYFPIFAMALVAGPANAVDLRQYASLKISDVLGARADISHIDSNAGVKESFGIKAAYGVKLADFRTELELSVYEKASVKSYDADFRPMTLMANIFYEMRTNSPFSPYIGAGIGYSRISVNAGGIIDDTDATLATHGLVGVAWSINNSVALDIGYAYTSFGKYDKDSIDASFTGHELSLGMRYSF